jgi:hypothetical protein
VRSVQAEGAILKNGAAFVTPAAPRPLPPGFWTRPKPADPDGRLLQALLEERETTR